MGSSRKDVTRNQLNNLIYKLHRAGADLRCHYSKANKALFDFDDQSLVSVFKKAIGHSKTKIGRNCLDAYLNGVAVGTKTEIQKSLIRVSKSKDLMQAICELKYSVRISKLERFDERLEHFCIKLSEACNWKNFFSVNLYITPGVDKNCFITHGDPHNSIIYQVAGKKKWRFPKSGGRHIFHYNPDSPISDYRKSTYFQKTIFPGDCLFIPAGALHWVEAVENYPAIHLTIASYTNHTHQGLYDILSAKLKSYLELDSKKYKPIRLAELDAILLDIGQLMSSKIIESEVTKRNMLGFKFGLRER